MGTIKAIRPDGWNGRDKDYQPPAKRRYPPKKPRSFPEHPQIPGINVSGINVSGINVSVSMYRVGGSNYTVTSCNWKRMSSWKWNLMIDMMIAIMIDIKKQWWYAFFWYAFLYSSFLLPFLLKPSGPGRPRGGGGSVGPWGSGATLPLFLYFIRRFLGGGLWDFVDFGKL